MPKEGKSRIHCKKVVHPNSRKASKLARQAHRDEKLQRKKAERNYLNQIKVGEKFRWFYENIGDEKALYSCSEVCHLIERYLHRFDEELRQINEQNNLRGRHGRTNASREDALSIIIERETELYNTCGIELPDLTSTKTLAQFKDWNCDVASLKRMKMRKFYSSMEGNKQETISDMEKTDETDNN
ncbi:translation machinery-associated protein 16-like [Montipora capricornis]|uniref:translation machinery-associated protein 16-like n=1 Tax=Montipora capricornis TaxID=246305 RepID=UPI0035F1DD42